MAASRMRRGASARWTGPATRSAGAFLIAWAALLPLAWPQTGGDAELAARSAALSESDRARARSAFAVGFELWKSGDCAAAVEAFGHGLTLDPASAPANFYHGDCLQRLRRRPEATEALRRAAAFGEGTSEGYKARAALKEIAKPAADLREMGAAERAAALLGAWELTPASLFGGSIAMEIVAVDAASIELRGSYNLAGCDFGRGEIRGNEIVWSTNRCSHQWRGRYTGPGRIEGTWTHGTFSAVRKP